MEEVLEKIRPSQSEKDELEAISNELIELIDNEAHNFNSQIYSQLLGSASRDTWLKNEKDLDIFLMCPPHYSKDELERMVTAIGKKVLKKNQKRYAEHPYIKGEFKGFDVEIVPCYNLDSPEKLKSAVDRTPFHNDYVKKEIVGREDQVRLLKQFLRGIGCYGAEARVEGFSGYLTELLIIEFGTFESVLKGTTKWKPGELIDFYGMVSENDIKSKFKNPLIVIDPVDKNRNVASALSMDKFSLFLYASSQYLKNPRVEFFFPEKGVLTRSVLLELFKKRGSALLAVKFETPDVIEDIYYPQLRKALMILLNNLEKNGFVLLSKDFTVSEKTVLLFELENLTIPKARLHMGPPVYSNHQDRFLEKHRNSPSDFTRPFIRGSRWYVLVSRDANRADMQIENFLSGEDISYKGIPSHVADAISRGFELSLNEHVFQDELLGFLSGYLNPGFPWEG